MEHEPRIPGATYRLQLGADLGLERTAELVAYLHQLGVDTLYLSPILAARPGSLSGYDVIDPLHLDPRVGAKADLDHLALALHERDMGLLLDIVPNHMAVCSDNPFWSDVLVHGRGSEHAPVFDIHWDAGPALPGEEFFLVLPALDVPYQQALAEGTLKLACAGDRVIVDYRGVTWPVAHTPAVAGAISAWQRRELSDIDALVQVLDAQRYRLGYWRTFAQKINYRRFFDISDLVCVRVEDQDVFDLVHGLVLRWARRGLVTGLRIDHIDGLLDPQGYLERLQHALPCSAGSLRFYVIVEKILSADEALRADWPVYGTTGYEFVRALSGVFVDPAGLAALDRIYARFLGFTHPFQERLYQQKKRVMRDLFPAEVGRLTDRLCRLAVSDPAARDVADHDLCEALVEVAACFPVYRTYVRDLAARPAVHPDDRRCITAAVSEAKKRNILLAEAAYDFVTRLLTLDIPAHASPAIQRAWLDVVLRWQQLTGPIMAKGLEDTALYQDFRLLSLNAVGGEPDPRPDTLSVRAFHRHNQVQQAAWPHSLVTTSTHDSKRSEDVRARLHVLADLPVAWSRALSRWGYENTRHKQAVGGAAAPTRNEEVLIYQTLLGAWPLDHSEEDEFIERFIMYIIKASREAKVRTSWLDTNEPHEQALVRFIRAIVDDAQNPVFMADFRAFHRRLAFYGAINALSQVLLKATAPGVPDFYQGTELWTFTLVDPDNRRPVDFARRARMLAELTSLQGGPRQLCLKLLDTWRDGRIKLHVTHRALCFRRDHHQLFAMGEYLPVDTAGVRRGSICVFARCHAGQWSLTAVPMRVGRLTAPGTWPTGKRCWRDTGLLVPRDGPRQWRNCLTGEVVSVDGQGTLPAARVFRTLPVALLHGLS